MHVWRTINVRTFSIRLRHRLWSVHEQKISLNLFVLFFRSLLAICLNELRWRFARIIFLDIFQFLDGFFQQMVELLWRHHFQQDLLQFSVLIFYTLSPFICAYDISFQTMYFIAPLCVLMSLHHKFQQIIINCYEMSSKRKHFFLPLSRCCSIDDALETFRYSIHPLVFWRVNQNSFASEDSSIGKKTNMEYERTQQRTDDAYPTKR